MTKISTETRSPATSIQKLAEILDEKTAKRLAELIEAHFDQKLQHDPASADISAQPGNLVSQRHANQGEVLAVLDSPVQKTLNIAVDSRRPALVSITSDDAALPAAKEVPIQNQNMRLAFGPGSTLNSLLSTQDVVTQQGISTENSPEISADADNLLAIDGGKPTRDVAWPTYDKGAVQIHPDDEEAAMRAIRSHLYFRYDYRPQHKTECGQLEQELADFFGVKHVLAVSSGTAALALAIMGARIPAGSLIAVPGFTFAATPSAIILAGCKPLLVEVNQDLLMDVDDLRRRWKPAIKAILVVHMRGFAADVRRLKAFADEMGVPLLEDAVPALGVELHGRKLGTYGLAGAFSTQSDKALNSGEGGFLVTNDTELYARAAILSGAFQGRIKRHFPDGALPFKMDLKLPIFSFRMDEIRAALLRSELRRLPQRLARFSRNYKRVSEALADIPEISIREPVGLDARLGESFIFRVHGGGASWFTRALKMEGIDASNLGMLGDSNVRVFWNWRFLFETDNIAIIQAKLRSTTRFLQEAIDIPLSSTLSVEDCDQLVHVIRRIANALNKKRQPEL